MFIFINSLKNIIRNKWRYLTAGIFLISVQSLFVTSLIITNCSNEYIEEQQNYYNSKVFIDYKTNSKHNITHYVKKDFFEDFAESEYIKSLTLSYSEEFYIENYPDIYILFGLDNYEEHNSGEFFIKTGNNYQNNGECIINIIKAQELNLNINDEINFTDNKGDIIISLKIVGIYESINSKDSQITVKINGKHYYISNMIYTNFNTAYYAYSKDEDSKEFDSRHEFSKYTHVYFLKNANDLEKFVQQTKNLPDDLQFSFDKQLYEQIINPFNQIREVSNIFSIIMMLIAGVIVFLIIVLMLKERSYEIGILFSFGASKINLIKGFIYEVAAYMCFITIISLFIGKIGAIYLIKEKHIWVDNAENFLNYLNINSMIAIQLLLFIFIIILISTLITLIFMLNLSPIKILYKK